MLILVSRLKTYSAEGFKNDDSARSPNLTFRHVTLNFDLLTPKVDRFVALPHGQLASNLDWWRHHKKT